MVIYGYINVIYIYIYAYSWCCIVMKKTLLSGGDTINDLISVSPGGGGFGKCCPVTYHQSPTKLLDVHPKFAQLLHLSWSMWNKAIRFISLVFQHLRYFRKSKTFPQFWEVFLQHLPDMFSFMDLSLPSRKSSNSAKTLHEALPASSAAPQLHRDNHEKMGKLSNDEHIIAASQPARGHRAVCAIYPIVNTEIQKDCRVFAWKIVIAAMAKAGVMGSCCRLISTVQQQLRASLTHGA